MQLRATEVGIFEDYDDEQAIDVGIAWVDEDGTPHSLSFQRCTAEPEEQDIRAGMDSYCVCTERGLTVYGCLQTVQLESGMLTLVFVAEDADIFGIPGSVTIDLRYAGVDEAIIADRLRDVLDWGSPARRPVLLGL